MLKKHRFFFLIFVSILIASTLVFTIPKTFALSGNWQVIAASDDCDVYAGALYLNAVDQWFSHGSYIMQTGNRFQNITIPQGATILTAIMSNYILGTTGTATVTIRCEANDNASEFSTYANFNARTRTTASINDTTFGGVTGWSDSEDLSAIIQEVINRVGWVSGNSLTILTYAATGQLQNQARAYDNQPTLAAKLTITYSVTPPDTTKPTYALINSSTIIPAQICIFSCNWTDNVAMDWFIFGWNNSGVWVNDSASYFNAGSWANVTKTLNATDTYIVQFEWWANDTSNNWNNTGIQSITLTSTDVLPYLAIGGILGGTGVMAIFLIRKRRE